LIRSIWNVRCEISRNVETSQQNLDETASEQTPGGRLSIAFRDSLGLEDRKKIAEILGFQTDKAVYKVINGERELSFEALVRFRNSTKRSIDWLLTGEGQKDIREINEYSIEDLVSHLLTELNELPITERQSKSLKIIHEITQPIPEIPILKEIKPSERAKGSHKEREDEQATKGRSKQ
jgi:plasmid maintenance system antidote protein VapI